MARVELTRALYHRGLSEKGFLRPAQFRALGFDGVFKGWKKTLIGATFEQEQIDEFVRLRKMPGTKKDKRQPKFKRKRGTQRVKCKKPNDPEKYRHPEWLKKRAVIYARDRDRCVNCGKGRRDGFKIAVHHLAYDEDKDLWDVPDWYLVTLCEPCHTLEHGKRLKPPPKIF